MDKLKRAVPILIVADIAAIHRPRPPPPNQPFIHGSAYGEFWPGEEWRVPVAGWRKRESLKIILLCHSLAHGLSRLEEIVEADREWDLGLLVEYPWLASSLPS